MKNMQSTYIKFKTLPNIRIIGVLEEEDKKTDHEKILEEIIVENFPKIGKEIITQVQETQSPKQDKPKVKHPKTHINQINKDQTQRTNIKSSKEKTTNNTQGNCHKETRDQIANICWIIKKARKFQKTSISALLTKQSL